MSELAKKYMEGLSLRELAKLFNIHYLTVRNRLIKEGIQLRQDKHKNKAERVLELHKQGLSARKIAFQLGMSHPTVSSLLKFKPSNDPLDKLCKFLNSHGFNFHLEECGIHDKIKKFSIYYVSFSSQRDRKYCRELQKRTEFDSFVFFQDEWFLREKQIKEFLLSKLGKFNRKIFARKCKIMEVDRKEAVQFISANHIQSTKDPAIINFGLFLEAELLGLVQLRKHHRNSIDVTISRVCFLAGAQVVGGFSRLVKYSTDWCFRNNYDKVITWSDNRFTNGNSYLMAGFQLDKQHPPDYSYIKLGENKRKSKQSTRKKKIGAPPEVTEWKFMEEMGYARIWDSGKKKFLMTGQTNLPAGNSV